MPVHLGPMTKTTQKAAATTEQVTLIEAEPLSYQIARGDDREAKAYDVYVGNTHVGIVRNGSRAKTRKSGRIRISVPGYAAHWAIESLLSGDRDRREPREKSRKAAVEALVTAYEESKVVVGD